MPPDMQSPRQLATTPPDLIVRPGFRPPSGGPPGTYRPDPAGGAAPYRPGSGGGGRPHQGDGRDAGQADPQGPALGRRGAVNLQNYPRMLSRNINGTVVMTSQPTNDSELQLYRVLQRANLLNYYDTFISQGGDDVQQLCEAGEEEFLEIMALVGMASKPLHVRRLQKALQEWVQNPGVFLTPLVPAALGSFPAASAAAAAAAIRASGMGSTSGTPPTVSISQTQAQAAAIMAVAVPTMAHSSIPTSLPALLQQGRGVSHSSRPGSGSPPLALTQQSTTGLNQPPPRPTSAHSPSSLIKDRESRLAREPEAVRGERSQIERPERVGSHPSPAPSPQSRGAVAPTSIGEESGRSKTRDRPANLNPSWDLSTSEDAYSGDPPGPPTSPLQLTPVLVESQISRIAETAATLVKSLPDLEPKQPNIKKKICKELEQTNFFQIVMGMSDEEPSKKMDEIRKFSAIYGRFDCKRKPEKPLTLHEVSVNEAAAQICRLAPAMLTRRDELFPLARQVVRDSGYQYSKGHSRSQGLPSCKLFSNGEDGIGFKRMRFSEDSEMTQRWRERMDQILEEARICQEKLEELKMAAVQAQRVGDIPRLQGLSQQVELCHAKQQDLLRERDDHQRLLRFSSRMSTCSDPDRGDTDDEVSQRSYSNASSPSASLQAPPNYVLSASGGQIIAVQNPALSLSGAFPVGRGSPPVATTGARNLSASPTLPPSSPAPLKQEPSSPPRD